ncbi:2-dehydro-3-deoxygalactonokinase [Piscinibacter sp.]|jgi:2-dehydro-3-deoxygalactonokinase|uniref:2-dehydro-3-deoxygalactonokinase n=1 Tax=Piscinibacter sp. TaxID=1903157 RepID=UPI00355937BF
MTPALIGIDWGTTHRRAYLLDARGHLLAEASDAQGMLACQGRFRPALDSLLQEWPEAGADVPVLMSGMVGAATGWQEARYLDAGTPLVQLAQQLVAVRDAPPGRRWAIVPGYCIRDAGGRVDVMRGEETQLLGALTLGHGDGWYVLPGTHSKWVRVDGGRVSALRTYMTGELFALLTQHGTLASVAGGAAPDALEAFAQGLTAAGGAALSHALFTCRARVVSGDMPALHARSYLSGLLIGAEWCDALRAPEPLRHVSLIGSAQLANSYAVAAKHHGCDVTVLDPREIYLAALNALGNPSR